MTFDKEYFNLGYFDTLSYKDTFIHRLDPRSKLLVTIACILTVVSFPKYEISGLMPFFLFPVLIMALGDIPARFIMKKVLLVSPFAIFIGIFNPILDTSVAYDLFGLKVSGGWISFFSIIIKFILAITSALLLIATTSFPGVCHGLQRIRVPEIFITQLLFLYRYIFVLVEEAMKIVRARDMRSFGKKGYDLKVFISLISVLFVRTIERAERIYQAMLSRGFDGSIHPFRRYQFSISDAVFTATAFFCFYYFRKYNVVSLIGEITTRVIQ